MRIILIFILIYPHVRRAALHIDGHVRRFHPEIPDLRLLVVEDQLPAVFHQGGTGKPGLLEQPVYLFSQPSLGKRYVKHPPVLLPSVSPACSEIRQTRWPGPSAPSCASAGHTARRSARCRESR